MDYAKALTFLHRIQSELSTNESVMGVEVYFTHQFGIITTVYVGKELPTTSHAFKFLESMSREELNAEFVRLKEFVNNI